MKHVPNLQPTKQTIPQQLNTGDTCPVVQGTFPASAISNDEKAMLPNGKTFASCAIMAYFSSAESQVVPSFDRIDGAAPDLSGDIQKQPLEKVRLAIMTLGFVLLIIAAILPLCVSSLSSLLNWTPLLSCIGLILHMASNKIGHWEKKEKRKNLERENKILRTRVQSQNQKEASQQGDSPRAEHVRAQHSKTKLVASAAQSLGFFSIFASAIITFYPNLHDLTPVLMQAGWAIFVVGTGIENYRQSVDQEQKQKNNVLLKRETGLL